jgi:hypothetical protein
VAFLQGLSPETIAEECFPVLTLEQVYGAITYYLAHRVKIDTYLAQAGADFEDLRKSLQQAEPDFTRKLVEARRQIQMTR